MSPLKKNIFPLITTQHYCCHVFNAKQLAALPSLNHPQKSWLLAKGSLLAFIIKHYQHTLYISNYKHSIPMHYRRIPYFQRQVILTSQQDKTAWIKAHVMVPYANRALIHCIKQLKKHTLGSWLFKQHDITLLQRLFIKQHQHWSRLSCYKVTPYSGALVVYEQLLPNTLFYQLI